MSDVITKESRWSVAETVARLTAELTAREVKLFTIVDHSGEARAAGLDLRDTKLLIFGSPQAGTPVMSVAPLAALDLPLKALVWDDAGTTRVSYTAPTTLAQRYGLAPAIAAPLSAIDRITDAAVDGSSS